MAAPTHSTKNIPTGYKMPNGWVSRIAFGGYPGVNVWEMSIKPRSVDSGGPIDTTTMLNVKKRTKASKILQTDGPLTLVCAYDPDCRIILELMVGTPQSFTQYFPTADYEDFYGFVDKAEFNELKMGEMPQVTLTIEVTDWDIANQIEAGPVLYATPGT